MRHNLQCHFSSYAQIGVPPGTDKIVNDYATGFLTMGGAITALWIGNSVNFAAKSSGGSLVSYYSDLYDDIIRDAIKHWK